MQHSRSVTPKKATRYDLCRLAQFINTRHASGYSGSRTEQKICKEANIKPTFAERVK